MQTLRIGHDIIITVNYIRNNYIIEIKKEYSHTKINPININPIKKEYSYNNLCKFLIKNDGTLKKEYCYLDKRMLKLVFQDLEKKLKLKINYND